MSRAALSVLERLGADDIDRFIDACARRERIRRADLQRKASAAAGGTLAAFLVAAGAEAREEPAFAQPDAGIAPDDYRVASAEDILSFAKICATEGEGSIFDHAVHAARSFAAASFEEGFASRLASRFAGEHGEDHRAGDHAAAQDGAHDGSGSHAALSSHGIMSAHASHSGETSALSGHDHEGSQGSAGAGEAPAARAAHDNGEGIARGADASGAGLHASHAAGPVADNAGGAVEPHTADHGLFASDGLSDAGGDLTAALAAFLGAEEPRATAADEAQTFAATALDQGDHGHATLADIPAEVLVAPLADI